MIEVAWAHPNMIKGLEASWMNPHALSLYLWIIMGVNAHEMTHERCMLMN